MYTLHWPIIRNALKHPKRTAIVDDQRTWRYIDIVGGAFHLAQVIERTSTTQNVAILLPTSGAFPMTLLAILLLKKTAVPVNYLLSAEERQYIIDDSEADTLISVGPMLEFLGDRPKNVNIIELDKLSFKGIPPFRLPPLTPANDTAVILYTSGTSGKPKGVMLTHKNLRSDIEACSDHAEIYQNDALLGVLPQFHSFGLTALTLLPLFVGGRAIYSARFVPRKIIDLIKKHRPSVFVAIPSMYNALLTVKDAGPEDFTSLRHVVSGGEPLSQAVFDKFQERFNLTIREGYGLTETSPVISWGTPDHWRPKSVGKLLPSAKARILDDDGNILPPGEEGEILLTGPMIMKGYFHLPDLTRKVITNDGYFITGDWGKLDKDGFLYITGRKKEMLIIGGENVFPREIEEVLNTHPDVKDSAVIGKNDDVRGELPVAFIELNEDAEFDERAVRNYCRETLAGFKVPREINVLEALPRNATGKIMRRELTA